jgi:hypothetical protein
MIDCNKENESNMHVVSILPALSYAYRLVVDNGGTYLNLTQTSHNSESVLLGPVNHGRERELV